ncbi:MAG: nascent polypeptide-associated complex protein [Candidatus Anstonellaceae archaeon]
MIPPNMDPKQIERMLRQFGMESNEIESKEVVIFTPTTKIIIENPQVIEINFKGQKSYQISGKTRKEPNMLEEDIKLVMEKTGCSKEKAIEALKNSNMDIAKAILDINEEENAK